jgi:hypothetical protein
LRFKPERRILSPRNNYASGGKPRTNDESPPPVGHQKVMCAPNCIFRIPLPHVEQI